METKRQLDVLDRRLPESEYSAGSDYTTPNLHGSFNGTCRAHSGHWDGIQISFGRCASASSATPASMASLTALPPRTASVAMATGSAPQSRSDLRVPRTADPALITSLTMATRRPANWGEAPGEGRSRRERVDPCSTQPFPPCTRMGPPSQELPSLRRRRPPPRARRPLQRSTSKAHEPAPLQAVGSARDGGTTVRGRSTDHRDVRTPDGSAPSVPEASARPRADGPVPSCERYHGASGERSPGSDDCARKTP